MDEAQLSVFKRLQTESLRLQSDTEEFRDECIKLAAMNGKGDKIRKKIKKSLSRILEQPKWVE